MKKLAFVLIFFSGLNVFAQKTDLTSIKILGRGIENHKTHEVISFACLHENCSTVQGVLFNADRTEAHFQRDALHWIKFGSVVAIVVKSSAMIVAGSAPILLIPAAFLAAVVSVYGRSHIAHQSLTSTAFNNSNGWNWSIKPRVVSNRSFEAARRALDF